MAPLCFGVQRQTRSNVLKYKNKVTEGKPDLPVVLLVDNVSRRPTEWMGRGLAVNSQHEMDNFCLEHGFFAWFEMRERAGGENSVFGQAMSTLINEIISRNSRNRIPETLTTNKPKHNKHSCICS